MQKADINTQLRDAFSLPHNQPPRVLIWGLGVHGGGEGMVRFFSDLDWDIVVHDPKPKKRFASTQKKFIGKRHMLWELGTPWKNTLLRNIDLVIKNPGVPLTHEGLAQAKALGIPITNDADIFTRLVPRERIIGVTGTKGKTTTTTLIAHLLGKDAIAVGIPGVPFLTALATHKKYIVAEYSSFDCDLLTTSPHIALCTSLFPDHLNRYARFSSYVKAKENLWKQQTTQDILLTGKTIQKKFIKAPAGKRLSSPPLPKHITLPYTVHPESASLAIAVAQLCNIPKHLIAARLKTYHGQEGRRERVKNTKHFIAFNDTTATNPGSATSSLLALKQHFPHAPRMVIVGGEDKAFPDTDLRTLARALRTTHTTYLIPGSFSRRLLPYISKKIHLVSVPTIRAAVRSAIQEFPRGVLLLSPGAASFNQYTHEFERGRDFVSAVIHYTHGKIPRRH